ncbi:MULTISPECIES: hypothetical protein [unclassified Variovorax]|uniref:hypothetical protein n=1 Tax=unclassified Variovorax TaxID=663243 RepID=UPI003ECD39ED
MDREIWIAVCAHRLQRQWRTVDPEQLDELAADLWKDERLRALAPDDAATLWLEPLASADGQHPGRSRLGGWG